MKQYIGTKMVQAEPLNRGDYNKLRGWQIPADENPTDEGYRIVYSDDYVSWSPKEAFDQSYRPATGLTFGLAVEAMKLHHRIARTGWNGKGMWLRIVIPGGDENRPYVEMKTADNMLVPWVASQTDLLAEDWVIV